MNEKAWITTYTGRKFYLLDPRIEDVDVLDIAHSLAMQCRWVGHTKHHYSIAQHAYYCSFIGPEEEAFHRLNHDDSEAYISDMGRPLKHYTDAGAAYMRVEEPLQRVIYNAFGLSHIEPDSVKIADRMMLWTEKAQLLNAQITETGVRNDEDRKAAPFVLERWTPEIAERMFLFRFNELNKRRTN